MHGDQPLDLRCNTRLQNLRLQSSDCPSMLYRANITASWIVDVLSTLRSFEFLELLDVRFAVDAEHLRQLSHSDAARWRHLDQMLGQNNFTRLRNVRVGFKFYCHTGSQYTEETRQCMPGLRHAGILDVFTEPRQ